MDNHCSLTPQSSLILPSFLQSSDLTDSSSPPTKFHASHNISHYLRAAYTLVPSWFSVIGASHFPQILFLFSSSEQAQFMHGWEQQAWKLWDDPISIPRAAWRVLNFLTSHLEVSIFSHRNVNEVGVSFPATLLHEWRVPMGFGLENFYKTNSLGRCFKWMT